MIKVLFLCVHNSARSQMAEAFMNHFGGDKFIAESAGFEPGTLNPIIIEVMKESGLDISGKHTKGVWDLYKQGRTYHYVITVCDASAEQLCPIFPGITKRLSWPFPDPAAFTGTYEDKLEKAREVRDGIKNKIEDFVTSHQQITF